MVCGRFPLAQLHWRILEERACGPANIDLGYLKKTTINEVSFVEITYNREV